MNLIEKEIEVLWLKTIIYSLSIIILIVFLVVVPKKVFNENKAFELATSMALTSDDNLLLYDYEVYSTEERFRTGLNNDVDEIKQEFKSRNEIFAIQIYNEKSTIEIRDDYVYIMNPETPELNIEYYLVKEMEFDDISLPIRTFIMLFQDISSVVNNIYIAVLAVISVSLFTTISVKLVRRLACLMRYYKTDYTI